MSKLDEAEQRLQRAISGLEDAARAASTPDASSAVIDAELATVRARAAELESVNAEIAQRLDGAIAQIKELLSD